MTAVVLIISGNVQPIYAFSFYIPYTGSNTATPASGPTPAVSSASSTSPIQDVSVGKC